MRINLPAIGQSYKHDDLPLSAQVTRNWFPELNTETSVAVSLQPWPGAVVFSEGPTGLDRGMSGWYFHLYKVTDQTLYKIDENGAYTTVGTIAGTGRCTFLSSSEWLVIVTSGKVYTYDGGTLAEVTDVDLEAPSYGAYLNNQWIYSGTGSRFAVSDVADPTSVNGLSYATAEAASDLIAVPFVHNQTLYLFGYGHIESWYNSGVGSPPIDRIEGGVIHKGLASGAIGSLSSNDNYVYFLGDDRRVYQLVGAQVRSISTVPIARELEAATLTDVIGFCFSMYGQEFYQLRVVGKTFVFNETAGAWFELSVGLDERQHPATSYFYGFGKHLIADGGNVLELSKDASLYNSEPIIRTRVSGLISGELLGQDFIGRPLFMSRCEIIIKGIPPLGDAPQIMLSWSDDAGYTWSNERVIDCGETGNYTFKAVAHQLGRFYDRVLRIRISDESAYSLHRVSGDIDVGA